MTNPIDEALMSKEAIFGRQLPLPGMGRAGSELVTGAQRMAGGLALLGGAGVVTEGARKLLGAVTKKRDFNAMIDANPDLQEAQQDNPKLFNSAYDSLRRINPTYAGDPLVAGGLMRQIMENPVNAGGIITSTVRDPDAGGPKSRFSVRDISPMNFSAQQDA